MAYELNLSKYHNALRSSPSVKEIGKLTKVTGFLLEGYLPGATLGGICKITPRMESNFFYAEIVGFRDRNVLFMPLSEMQNVGMGAQIILEKQMATVSVGKNLLGRVLDGLGQVIDEKESPDLDDEVSIYSEAPNALTRPVIREPLDLGVKAVNGLTTLGKGQRMGIMAGSGVGKSVLLGMMARESKSDVNVIALIGERGREVREFIEDILGEEGMKKSVVVVVTSDKSPLLRMRGAFVATAIAEYFSSLGKDVLFMMDSVTRFAMAQREIGLNIGEPPTTKGYTPSVFSLLPKLLERAGNFENKGSITGIYSVLVEGDDLDEPISDAVRSIVDGHIVLDRGLAHRGHFPAIDVLKSTSRVMRNVVSPEFSRKAQFIREQLANYKEAEDLINIGAYREGSNPKIDMAIQSYEVINDFLKQSLGEHYELNLCESEMESIMSRAGGEP